jgi:small subunit ribosomal protein S3Ae
MAKGKAKGRRKTVDKWKKKQWFTILASKIFDKKPLAETPAEKAINLESRTIKITLDKLTGQRNKRDITITFKADNIQGQNINTKISKFELGKSLLRLVRRRNSKIGLVEKIPVKEGDAKISLVTVTHKKATQSQKTAIRKIMFEELNKLKGKDFEDVVKELLLENFVGKILKKANSICIIKKVVVAKAVFIKSK